jgi:ABC-type sugar transport system permease subunit
MALLPSWWVGMGPMQRREARAGLLFVLPWLLSLVIFTAYPAFTVFYLSLTDYNVVQAPTWIGLQNYRTMVSVDPAFWTSVRNTATYTLLAVPLGLAGSLGLAHLLNLPGRGVGVYPYPCLSSRARPTRRQHDHLHGHVQSRRRADQCRTPAGWVTGA